jgi:hypothetical protein
MSRLCCSTPADNGSDRWQACKENSYWDKSNEGKQSRFENKVKANESKKKEKEP